MLRVRAIGWRAQAALRETHGAACVLAALSESLYLTVGAEIAWVGPAGASLHGRALLARDPLPEAAPGDAVTIDTAGARPWRPRPLDLRPPAPAALAAGCRGLVAAVSRLGPPGGLGVLLTGATPAFPLDRAAAPARALARACGADDAPGAVGAARALLGLGPGLTPAGDDYVGGAFFARALLAGAGPGGAGAWRRAADAVRAAAGERTHPISAALLGDLCAGHGHAPLHELAAALAAGGPRDDALDAAWRLTRIGHSSGWDILAGFVAGALGALP